MLKWDDLDLSGFLASQSKMRLVSYDDAEITLAGTYRCQAQKVGHHAIDEQYPLKIHFPPRYPLAIPTVIETGGRITRHPDFHTYMDGSFCLGSEIRIRDIIRENPRLTDFSEKVLDPFLYSVSHKIRYGDFPYGELAHGEPGLIDDYERLFHVRGKKAVLGVLQALGVRKRVANKLPCPCFCGYRMGRCDFRFQVEGWRNLARRQWYRQHAEECFTPIEKEKKRRRKKQRHRKRH